MTKARRTVPSIPPPAYSMEDREREWEPWPCLSPRFARVETKATRNETRRDETKPDADEPGVSNPSIHPSHHPKKPKPKRIFKLRIVSPVVVPAPAPPAPPPVSIRSRFICLPAYLQTVLRIWPFPARDPYCARFAIPHAKRSVRIGRRDCRSVFFLGQGEAGGDLIDPGAPGVSFPGLGGTGCEIVGSGWVVIGGMGGLFFN
jgi:hypothetical protein